MKSEGNPMTVVGDGKQRRDYTHVSDVVNANLLAAESNSVGNAEVLNIGTGKSYSVMDLVEMIGGEHIYIPPRPGESRHTLADISRANMLLKWNPKVKLEDWLEENK